MYMVSLLVFGGILYFHLRTLSKGRMVKENRVEYSVSELMHVFELSLKGLCLNLLKAHFDSYNVFLALRPFLGTNGSNRNFSAGIKCLLPWIRAHTCRGKYDPFYFCPIPDSVLDLLKDL